MTDEYVDCTPQFNSLTWLAISENVATGNGNDYFRNLKKKLIANLKKNHNPKDRATILMKYFEEIELTCQAYKQVCSHIVYGDKK